MNRKFLIALGFMLSLANLGFQPIAQAMTPECELLSELTFRYELPETEIKNQCGTSGCWYFSYLARVERNFALLNRKIKISEEDFTIQLWRKLIKHALNKFNSSKDPEFKLSSRESEAPAIAEAYGAIPAEAWQGLALSKWPIKTIIENVLAEIKRAREAIKEKDAEYAKLVEEGTLSETDRNSLLTRDKKRELKSIMRSTIYDVVGNPVNEFLFEGRKVTPVEFVAQNSRAFSVGTLRYAAIDTPAYDSLAAPGMAPGKTIKKLKDETKDPNFLGIASIEEIEDGLPELFKAKVPLSIGFVWDKKFIDMKSGIMRYDPNQPKSIVTNQNEHNCAVLALGHDANGELVIKLQNSWGKHRGANGYLFMYASYLREFAMQITSE